MDLAVQVGTLQRQEIGRIGLTWHAIDPTIPRHFHRSVFLEVRMKMRRPEFDGELGNRSADPTLHHIVPGLIGAGIGARRYP